MIDRDIIRRWWNVFVGDGNFTEVRILGRFQYSGYFKSIETLISAIEPYANMEDEQLYFVLNRIDDSCYGRQQCEKIIKAKITTNDNDIIRRRWVLCDFDPVRKSGTNSSNDEFELAHRKAQDVFRFLQNRGFSEPVICKSGNGWHLLYHIDEDVSDDNTEIIRNFFKYMGSQFTDDKVDFDEKNFNAARVCKLYGTVAKKGANLDDRPWRMSEIVFVPEEIKTTPIEKFKELADLLPKEESKTVPIRRQYQGSGQFDLRTWLSQHGISYKEDKQGSSTRFTLEYCPWVDTHSDKKKWDSALFLDQDGKITFNCQHSHCKGKTWQDVRLYYEPNAYDKPAYEQRLYQSRQYVSPKPRYEIKEHIPELGDKWLSMSSIKKINLSSLSGVKTGIHELDRAIQKLYDTEVSIITGGNASGKSSFINTLICNFLEQGVGTALWTGELIPQIQKTWIQMVAAGKRNLRPSNYGDGKFYVPDHIGERIDKWMDGRFFLYNNEYGNTWEQIFHDMNELVNAGVKMFILDNLFSLNIDLLEGDKNNKQKELIVQIKDFSKKNRIHIILVAHPRKTLAFMRKNDISGTGDLSNCVDNVFIMHRVNNDFFRAGAEFFGQAEIQRFQGYGNVMEVAKNRMWGVVDLMVGMHYEIETRRFKNDEYEDVSYGWEQDPVQMTMDFSQEQNYTESDHNLPFSRSVEEDAPF